MTTTKTTKHNITQNNTVKEQLVQVIFTNIITVNGENTEEDLNMLISERIASDKIKNTEIVNKNSLKGCVRTRKHKDVDLDELEPNGVWVYKDATSDDWMFDRYDTVADAVRAAINTIGATIICNGDIIVYDTIDKKTAYYVDSYTDMIKIVNLKK
jgi:hypothetical protein